MISADSQTGPHCEPEDDDPVLQEKRLDALNARLIRQQAFREQAQKDLREIRKQLETTREYLGIADRVTDALESLSEQLFERLLNIIQEKLTKALQEILEQPIELKSRVDWKRNSIAVDFHIERDGCVEDILRGQGGSVANILSIGLRLFALTTLDGEQHRRVLILDEQDCWLRPELVPKLVRIIKGAGTELGFQILLISHHDVSTFEGSADQIYRLIRNGDEAEILE